MDKINVDSAHHQGSQRAWGTVPFHAVWCRLALALSLTIACQSALGQAMFRIKPIGPSGTCDPIVYNMPQVTGLNDADAVVGAVCNANGDAHAFLWRNNGKPMVDLGPTELGSTSGAFGINASGLVVGSATDSTGSYGFVSYGNGAAMTKIRNRIGGTSAGAYALNDAGQVTGWADNPSPNTGTSDAFLWKGDGSPMLDLDNFNVLGDPESSGDVINAFGQIAGTSYDGDRSYHAFVWKNDGSPVQSLGSLGGYRTSPCCINASGQIAGESSVSGYSHPHAFLWRNDGTRMQDLGTLGVGSMSGAYGLNDSGQVVGWAYTHVYKGQHAFLWMNDGTPMKDLGTLGGNYSAANDINASGQVTGWSYLAGDAVVHASRWINGGTKIQDLNTLIDPTDPLKPYVTLTNGAFINDVGDIVAEGTDSRTGGSAVAYLLQGTVITLNPRSLAFGNQKVGTSSSAKQVTVTNTSSKAAAITSIALSGTTAGQFASTNNCGKSLVGHATCTIKVAFKPTTKGAKSGLLNVNGGGGGLRTVTLTGTGT